jgi:hypothetical protein
MSFFNKPSQPGNKLGLAVSIDLYRLMPTRTLVLLPISLLLLCGTACERENGTPKGFIVDVATSAESCGDGTYIVAAAIGGHRAKLNAEPDRTYPETVKRLREVMSYRAERVVYVKAETGVPWGEFMELVDDVWPEVNVVSILTPQVEAMSRRTFCLGPSCRDCARFGGFHSRPQ